MMDDSESRENITEEDVDADSDVDFDAEAPESPVDKESLLLKAQHDLSLTDYILEPRVFETLISFLSNGGEAKEATKRLSENYKGLAQLCNTVGKWLVDTGMPVNSVQGIFEQHLSSLIEKNFDPTKANAIFEETEGVDWLSDLIAYSPWRSLLYRLAETTPDCLMLNFVVKLISDAGFQHEISSVQTASQQLEIFSRMLVSAVGKVLSLQPFTQNFNVNLAELVRVACHSEHTYLYTQCLLITLASQEKEMNFESGGSAIQAISQLLRLATEGQLNQLLNVSNNEGMSLVDTSAVSCGLLHLNMGAHCPPPLTMAMHSMLSKKSLNPADMTQLYLGYSCAKDPETAPAVELIRDPLFIDLLIDALFKPGSNSRLQDAHRPKYIFLLSYAASVYISGSKGNVRTLVVDELDSTILDVQKMSDLCQGRGDTAGQVLNQLPQIFTALKTSCVSCGVLHWVRCTVTENEYFRLHPEPVPIHLALLDEIASIHPLMHHKVFGLLRDLIEREGGSEGSSGEVLMERHRTFIDRLVHLLSVGYAIPVIEFMSLRHKEGAVDTSLIRYFVTETLDIVCAPFSASFIAAFTPLVKNVDIVDISVKEKHQSVTHFLEHCNQIQNDNN